MYSIGKITKLHQTRMKKDFTMCAYIYQHREPDTHQLLQWDWTKVQGRRKTKELNRLSLELGKAEVVSTI